MRRRIVLLVIGALVATLLGATPTASADPKPEAGPTVYVGQLTTAQVKQLSDLGLDRSRVDHDQSRCGQGESLAVEVILTAQQVAKLNVLGLNLSEKKIDGAAVSQRRLGAQAAAGYTVFRSYSEPGGIRDELVASLGTTRA